MTDSLFTGAPGIGDAADGQPINTATRFRVTAPVSCTHHRFYAPSVSPGTVTARLYELTSDTTGTLLAEKAYSAVNLSSYNTQAWDTPVALTTGKVYATQHHASTGHYVATGSALVSDVTSAGGLLVAIGDGSTVAGFAVNNGAFQYGSIAIAATGTAGLNFHDDVVVVSSAVTVNFTGAALLGGITAAGTFGRTVKLTGVAHLGGLTERAILAGGAAPDHAVLSEGSWYTLAAVHDAARQYRDQERNRPLVACPRCGEPLRRGGQGGVLFCRFDGTRYAG